MKDILDIHIVITDVTEVEGNDCMIKMIAFSGKCDCALFKGRVLPGGIDLQMIKPDGTGTVSARYILEGTDVKGKRCRIYVENTGVGDCSGNMLTTPKIVTDSKELGWLQQEILSCRFEQRGEEFHVIICI